MIRSLDAFKLARTKLKTRRIRLIITLIVMSLMFAALSFLAFFVEGGIRSLTEFSKEGYGSSVYVSAQTNVYSEYDNAELTAIIKPQHDALVAQKKALAKKLTLTYDEKIDFHLPLQQVQTVGGESLAMSNSMSKITQEALAAQNNAIPGMNYSDFAKTARRAGAQNTYQSTSPGFFYVQSPGSITVLKDGKETYTAAKQPGFGPPSGISSITQLGVTQMDEGLLAPFVLQKETMQIGQDGSIPIVAPFSAAEEMLGLKKLAVTADSNAKLERLITVRKEIAGKTALLCYRNNASQALLQQAIEQRDQIESNKNNKEYVKPTLLYALPVAACGTTTVASDKRSAEEKKQAANQKTFDTTFGQSEEPEQGTITVRIIGLTSDIPTSTSAGLTSIFTSIFSSYTGVSWGTPAGAISEGSLAAKAFGGTLASRSVGQSIYYAKFASLDTAKKFIEQNDCSSQANFDGSMGMNEFVKKCIASGKLFTIIPYGNNAGAIQELQRGIWQIGRYLLLAILVIASIVMMGTLGKIIADSRRETAVFRALGAKRFDISQIYITYALLISMLITVLSITAGAIGAYYVNKFYSPSLSVNAVLAYNASDPNKQFVVFGVNPLYIAIIVGLIVASALISAAIPLLTNMRRNPIRDMRDDS
jgi:hypothetical protein